MVDRRKFLRYSLLGAGAATVIFTTGSIAYKISHFEKVIVAMLSEDLKGLKVSRGDMKAYAQEVAGKNTFGFSYSKLRLVCMYPVHHYKWLPLPFKNTYIQVRAEIVGHFLLSTNFFFNNMDEQQEIKYFGSIYQPYRSACSNPFSASIYKA